jgi:hypothetical protein
MNFHLSINNKKVYEFYNNHPNITFEETSCLMVDLLKKIFKKNETIETSLVEKLLLNVNVLDNKINNIDKVFENKFEDFKKSYTQELNTILNNTTNEKTINAIKEYNESVQDKTKILFNEMFPKNNEIITNQINNTFNNFNSLISSSELRIQNNIESKLSNIGVISNTQNIISENINTLINKFHGSSTKGAFSEVSIFEGLSKIFPYGNVEHVGNRINNIGDILLSRKDKNTIMIENKEYESVVSQSEIDKFIENALINKCDGIMLSQNSQIKNKDDFEININGELILIYICNMGYNIDKIRTAISIIDHLKSQINFINKDKVNVSLSKEEIDQINVEYNGLLASKNYIIKMLNESHTKIVKEIESIKVPTMEYILVKEYGIKLTNQEICKWCEQPFKNYAGVRAHMKSCKKYLESEQFTIDKTEKENKKKPKKTLEKTLEIN